MWYLKTKQKKGTVFILIRILKHMKNEVKIHSKTRCTTYILSKSSAWRVGSCNYKCSLQVSDLSTQKVINHHQIYNLTLTLSNCLHSLGNQNIYPIAAMLLRDICFCLKSTDTTVILGKHLEFALIYPGQNKYLDFISYPELI